MRKGPKQSACHDRAERNDPNGSCLFENEEVAIRPQAGAAVEEQELLAERFCEREKELSTFVFFLYGYTKTGKNCGEEESVPERARAAFHDYQSANAGWEVQIKLEKHACNLKVGADNANDDGVEGHFGGATGGTGGAGGSGVTISDHVCDVFFVFGYHVVRTVEIIPHKKGKQQHGQHDGTKEQGTRVSSIWARLARLSSALSSVAVGCLWRWTKKLATKFRSVRVMSRSTSTATKR